MMLWVGPKNSRLYKEDCNPMNQYPQLNPKMQHHFTLKVS